MKALSTYLIVGVGFVLALNLYDYGSRAAAAGIRTLERMRQKVNLEIVPDSTSAQVVGKLVEASTDRAGHPRWQAIMVMSVVQALFWPGVLLVRLYIWKKFGSFAAMHEGFRI